MAFDPDRPYATRRALGEAPCLVQDGVMFHFTTKKRIGKITGQKPKDSSAEAKAKPQTPQEKAAEALGDLGPVLPDATIEVQKENSAALRAEDLSA